MTTTPTPWYTELIPDTHGAKVASAVNGRVVAMVYDANDADLMVERVNSAITQDALDDLEKAETEIARLEERIASLSLKSNRRKKNTSEQSTGSTSKKKIDAQT